MQPPPIGTLRSSILLRAGIQLVAIPLVLLTVFHQPADAQSKTKKPAVKATKKPGRGFLGVMAAASPTSGVLITSVAPGSPAAQAGLRTGDYVLSVDGKTISTPQQFRRMIEGKRAGSEIMLLSWRDGERTSRRITLGKSTPASRARIVTRRRPARRPIARRPYYCVWQIQPYYYEYYCFPRPYGVAPNQYYYWYRGPYYHYRFSE